MIGGSVYILGQNVILEEYRTTREKLSSRNDEKIETAAYILEKIDKDGFTYQYRTAEGAIYIDMMLLVHQRQTTFISRFKR